ncbi:aminopeptidase N [Ornithinimicrobium sp. Y1694]|uniref:aminopeptidase N n=1 Tax=Ornithinimicrobium sp. Y1694 TaxID=3418590 RepID=UPI003CFAD7E7
MSLTLAQARDRASLLSDIAYQVHLDLTGDDSFEATTTVTFTARPAASTFLDLQRAASVSVTLNGVPLEASCYRDDQVHLPDLAAQNTAIITARMPYVTDGDGMHRFVDPADGAVYAGCYGGMDVNRRVFACFDQPDLKAPFSVAVTARAGDAVLANGIPLQHPDPATGGTWLFAPTPPIATYLVTVNVGPWASRTWEHDGRPFGWHARASLADALDRDLPVLREQTEAAYGWYADRFDEPYPFDSYDQAFVPGHNWGAMETPGCVTYRDEMLRAGPTPEVLVRARAMTIAHEMAHMWFGDLVTFRWWEDTWLNESFADYLGFLVADATGAAPGALAEFDLGRKAGGYAADDRPSTHPVAPRPEDVPDVDSAFNNFDPISYAKGNASLRQLAFWLGEETFFAGVNAHLTGARFGTADLEDFVTSLQSVTDRDVPAWVEAWLRRSGTDVIRVDRSGGTPRLILEPGRSGRSRPHRLRVSGYAVSHPGASVARVWEEFVDLSPESSDVQLREADLIVPNSTGDTFARIGLDEESLTAVREVLGQIPDEHPRVILWATLLELAGRGEVEPELLVDAIERHLPGEGTAFVVSHVLRRADLIIRQVTEPGALSALVERLGGVALALLSRTDAPAAVVETAVDVGSRTVSDADLLRTWLTDGAGHGPLSQEQRWDVLVRLAELGADAEDLIAAERRQDPSAAGELAVLAATAARPTAEAKREALRQLADEGASNRHLLAVARGLWSAEQRDLVDPLVADYLRTMVPVAHRGQAMALVVGRAAPGFRWNDDQLADLESVLAEGGLPPVLARTWSDVLHDQRLLR